MAILDWLFGKRRVTAHTASSDTSTLAPTPIEPTPSETGVSKRQLAGFSPKSDWNFGVIDDPNLLDGCASGNVHEVAAIAIASWTGANKPPNETTADVRLTCPACSKQWNATADGITVPLTDNSQRLGSYGCPSCKECTVELRATVSASQGPIKIHLMATVFAATKTARIKPFRIEIISMQPTIPVATHANTPEQKNSTETMLVGSWSGPCEGYEFRMTLRPDMTFETRYSRFDLSENGTWHFSEPFLILDILSFGRTTTSRWQLMSYDSNQIELHSELNSATIRFNRKGN